MSGGSEDLTIRRVSTIRLLPKILAELLILAPALVTASICAIIAATANPWLNDMIGICVRSGKTPSFCLRTIFDGSAFNTVIMGSATSALLRSGGVLLAGLMLLGQYYRLVDGQKNSAHQKLTYVTAGLLLLVGAAYYLSVRSLYVDVDWLPAGSRVTCPAGMDMTVFHTCVQPGAPMYQYLP